MLSWGCSGSVCSREILGQVTLRVFATHMAKFSCKHCKLWAAHQPYPFHVSLTRCSNGHQSIQLHLFPCADSNWLRITPGGKFPKDFTLPACVEGKPLPNPSKVEAWPLMTDEDMRRLACNADNRGRITMHMHDVRHGDIMSPTPGHMHAVYNLHPLLKVAREVVKPGSYLRTAISLCVFALGVVGPRMAEDYTSFFALSHRKLKQDFWEYQQQQQQQEQQPGALPDPRVSLDPSCK